MNAPWPPPTMPSRSRHLAPDPVLLSLTIALAPSAVEAEGAPVGGLVGGAAREVLEALLGDADDVRGDELGPFARPVLGILEAALPFEHRPASVAVGGELAEDAAQVDLTVAQGPEAP